MDWNLQTSPTYSNFKATQALKSGSFRFQWSLSFLEIRFIREGFIEKLELEMSLKDWEGLGWIGSEQANASSVRENWKARKN